MKTTFRASFLRDLRKIKDQNLLLRIRHVIEEVEAVRQLSRVSNLKKMSGAADAYRIRIGDYRIGIILEGNTVDFIRCLHRRDLYRFFP